MLMGLVLGDRWTMLLRRRRSRHTLPRVGPSTALRSSSTSTRGRKGTLILPPTAMGFSPSPFLRRYAYVEFADPSLVANAVLLNESMFRGRLLKVRSTAPKTRENPQLTTPLIQVTPKRTNLPGMSVRGGRGRGGRGARGRGGFRGDYHVSRLILPIYESTHFLTSFFQRPRVDSHHTAGHEDVEATVAAEERRHTRRRDKTTKSARTTYLHLDSSIPHLPFPLPHPSRLPPPYIL